MKATIYLHIESGNEKILLENGEVWWFRPYSKKWGISKHKAVDLVNKPWVYTKLATVNNFQMLEVHILIE